MPPTPSPPLPPPTPPPLATPPQTPPPCPAGFSECSYSGCCSSEFGTWSGIAMSFLGIVLVIACCWCWKYLLQARSVRPDELLPRRPRTRRLSETSSAFPSSALPPSTPVSWHGEPPPVLPDEPPPLYQPRVAVIPLPLPLLETRDASSTSASLPLPPTAASATVAASTRHTCGQ